MNTAITILTEALVSDLKTKDQAGIYNEFAAALDIKPVKKFRDKATGIARILKIQEKYVEACNNDMWASIESNESLDEATQRIAEEPVKADPIDAMIERGKAKAKKAKVDPKPSRQFIPTDKSPSVNTAMFYMVQAVIDCTWQTEDDETDQSEDHVIERFIHLYKDVYKGKHPVNASFAKGYLAGAIRQGYITVA